MAFLKRREKAATPEAPWRRRHPFGDLYAAMDRMLGDLALERGWHAPTWFGGEFPSVNVSENVESVRVTADLPGMQLEDIEVTLQESRLVIAGEKTDEKEEAGRNWRCRERTSGSFRREIELPPDVDRKNIDATFKNGVLTIEIGRTIDEAARPTNIEVKSG